jgi:ABC-2 type transport system ATP-binding protein
MKVHICNLRKHFGATKALDDVSFQFEAGQVCGFVGPNGAGKTTAMRIVATLDEPTDGDAFVGGISVAQDPERARRLVGYMPDELPTHRDTSAHDYLDFFARAYGLRGRRRTETVASVEDFTNLGGIRDKQLRALSKGMKQRVSLARALIHDPPVLILDEPANGLDPRARIELRELLKVLAARGKAILISSHILTELAEICTEAVIIEKGRLLRAGGINQITSGDPAGPAVRTVLIRPVDRVAELHQRLLQTPGINSAKTAGGEVVAEVAGDEAACADLLAALVQGGFRIAEFHQRRAHLEDLFMEITKGDVQ